MLTATIGHDAAPLIARDAPEASAAAVVRSALVCGAMLASLCGCASLPPRGLAPPSAALSDVSDTTLGRAAVASLPDDAPALSGFRLLPEGETSFDARIALARRAQKSLGAQYYLIIAEALGRQFLREPRDAAGRGARVRLLVDDLYTAGEDPQWAS